MADFCLTLVCPPAVEEKLLDTLLSTPGADIFTSTATHSHGTPAGQLTAVEQVMGRSRGMQVQVLLLEAELEALLDALRIEFKGAGLRYWTTPVASEGEVA